MAWRIEGHYMETCNCSFLCPCLPSSLTAKPTEGDCKAAVAMRVDTGEKDGVRLDGVSFILLLHSPSAMADGNITAGLIVDDRATDAQTAAITSIALGEAGGPMAGLAPLLGKVAGVEKRPIVFSSTGLRHSVRAGELIDQECEGMAGAVRTDEPICLDNTAHPVNSKVAIAKATRSRFHAFGIDWEDASGSRNGHFAPFAWVA
jgi:hypothetical protein